MAGRSETRRPALKSVLEIAGLVLVNFLLPYAIYVESASFLGKLHALIMASVPPIVWSIVEFIRNRRIDAVSTMVVASIVLSLLALIGGGSVSDLQLRQNFVTAAIGLGFLVSAAIGRPLIYQLARAAKMRTSPAEVERFERLRDNHHFRRTMMIMTLVWGIGLLISSGIGCILVFSLSVPDYLIANPIVSYGIIGVLILWSIWYDKRQRRLIEAAPDPGISLRKFV
ncbi:MAG TPA: VC0807 family protein [Acidiphilium sp.]